LAWRVRQDSRRREDLRHSDQYSSTDQADHDLVRSTIPASAEGGVGARALVSDMVCLTSSSVYPSGHCLQSPKVVFKDGQPSGFPSRRVPRTERTCVRAEYGLSPILASPRTAVRIHSPSCSLVYSTIHELAFQTARGEAILSLGVGPELVW